MELTSFTYKLLPQLAALASTVTLEGVYPLERLEKGARVFTLAQPQIEQTSDLPDALSSAGNAANAGNAGSAGSVGSVGGLNPAVNSSPTKDALAAGISYQLQLTNTGGAVLLSGQAKTELSTICDRCLAPTTLCVSGEVEGYLVFSKSAEATKGYAESEENADIEVEFSVVDKDGSVDLAPFIYAAIVFALPQMVLCNLDCPGLCPHCGADLNLGSCDCSSQESAEEHPFAVLKQLL